MAERMYTPGEVAALWGLSPKTVRRMASDGRVGHVRIGRLIRIPESEVRRVSRPVYALDGGIPPSVAARVRPSALPSPSDLIRLKYGARRAG